MFVRVFILIHKLSSHFRTAWYMLQGRENVMYDMRKEKKHASRRRLLLLFKTFSRGNFPEQENFNQEWPRKKKRYVSHIGQMTIIYYY